MLEVDKTNRIIFVCQKFELIPVSTRKTPLPLVN